MVLAFFGGRWALSDLVTRLLPVKRVLTLSSQPVFPLLVLCDLMQGVLFTLLGLAVGFICIRNTHHIQRLRGLTEIAESTISFQLVRRKGSFDLISYIK